MITLGGDQISAHLYAASNCTILYHYPNKEIVMEDLGFLLIGMIIGGIIVFFILKDNRMKMIGWIRKRIWEKFLPAYIRLWPSWYWIAVWSAPRSFKANINGVRKTIHSSYWQALRITVRYNKVHSQCVYAIKNGKI